MSRLSIITQNKAQATVEELYKDVERRISASPSGLCPVDMAASFLKMCHAQSCGKCVPCRIGLGTLEKLLDDVLDGNASLDTIDLIQKTAESIYFSADCAIGYEAAKMVLKGIEGFRDDFVEHIEHGRCKCALNQPVPCVAQCPAGVDIPGYISLVEAGRNADAVRLIRKDNPLPAVCGLICEHPCEVRCRRSMMDASINIRGLKRFAVEHAGDVPVPAPLPTTGKKVAVIGGGPGGISAAYYLALMGHSVTLFEAKKKLGGMLRYGIPSYRLPREILDKEIAELISVGIDVRTETPVGENPSILDLKKDYDAVYIAIGAQTDKKIGIEGEDAKGVLSAVEMLRGIGDDEMPDFKGKDIIVIGGGNVAMDVARSSIRLGAKRVRIVYRRRQVDMTAMREEVEGAIQEGCEVLELAVPPAHRKGQAQGKAAALWVKPQIIGAYDRGRPKPCNSEKAGGAARLRQGAGGHRAGYRVPHDFEKHGIPVRARRHRRAELERDQGHSGRICGRRLRHGARDGHPRHRGGQGRGGEHRRISRLPPRAQRGRGDPAHPPGRPLSLRAREYDGAERVRAQKGFQADGMRHERGGGAAGSAGGACGAITSVTVSSKEAESKNGKSERSTISPSPSRKARRFWARRPPRAFLSPPSAFLKDINEIGACRVCVVEIKGKEKLIPACNNEVKEGMEIYTNSPKVRNTRKINVELILSQHDAHCATCVRSRNCSLQNLANDLDIIDQRFEKEFVKANWPKDFPLVRDANKCIKCMRCIQVCDKIQDMHVWDVTNTGSRTTVDVSRGRRIKETDCALCGQCITHCPTGALRERDDTDRVLDALADPEKITVVQIAPAVRAAWGETFGLPREFATTKRLVSALRRMGVNYVFDTNFLRRPHHHGGRQRVLEASARNQAIGASHVHLLLPGLGALYQIAVSEIRFPPLYGKIAPADVRRHRQKLLRRSFGRRSQ